MATSKRSSRRQPQSSGPGAITVAALKSLRDSGPKSFEDLVSSCLSTVAGISFRLCRSGLQPGVDALSAGAVGVEVKRYDRKLPIRDLQGALSDAASPELGLELWVAVSTVSLGGVGHRKLLTLGAQLGVAVLILDADSAQPLLPIGVPSITALCATDPDAVLHAIENWRDPKKREEIDLKAVREDLAAVRALSGFDAFLAKLQKDLDEPIWPLLVRRQNRWLANQIRKNPIAFFQVSYERSRSVRRKVEDDMEAWFSRTAVSEPSLAAVVGERFDGKTWCVLDWLLERLEALQIPVFFISSQRGDGSMSLEGIVLEQMRQRLGSFERHAPALLRRARNQPPERGPWALIVLDGLDEYRLRDPDQHLVWALESRRNDSPRVAIMGRSVPDLNESIERLLDEDIRPCAALCTCRLPSWRRLENRIEQLARERVSVLRIGPYDDAELARALAIENQPPRLIAGLSEEVQKLVRRPRYLRLLIDKLPQLDRYHEVTEDLMFWFDAQDQIRRSRPGARDWDETAYQNFLQNLAKRYAKKEGSLHRSDIRSTLGKATENIHAALQDLESEGVLETMPSGRYRIRPEQLRTGMGLHLLNLLERAKRKNKDLATVLHDALEPIPDSDPKVEWLRWAAIVSLYQGETSPDVVDTLVGAWLRSRNLPQGDIEQIRRLSSRLLASLLRLAPDSWSSAERNERMREISRLVILDNLEQKKEQIGEHVRSWMRMVPTRGPYFVEDEPGAGERVHSALQDPGIEDWGLSQCGDSGILWLQGFGLNLETLSPGLIGPEDLLTLMAVRHIPMYHFDSFLDSEDLVFRRRLAEIPLSWFEERVKEAATSLGTLRARTVHHFLLAADRADLLPMAESIAPAEEPVEKWEPPGKDNPMGFLQNHRHVVRDPNFTTPSSAELVSLRSAWAERFAAVKLADDPNLQPRSEDLDFERTLPAIAAWAPDVGANLIRQQMRELPATMSEGRSLWARAIERHAVLAEGDTRAPLVEVTEAKSDNRDIGLAVGHVLVSLLPGMSSSDVLDAVLDHHIGFEWRDLFEVSARLKTPSLRRLLLERIETEHDPRRLARSYYLLSDMDIKNLSPAQARKVVSSIESGDGDERIGALAVAAKAGLSDIPTEVLLPIATGSDRKTLAPRYAGWLLAHKGEAVDRLPVRWRAVAAAKHRRFREPFLRKVEMALGIRKGGTVSNRNEHQSTWNSEEFPRSLVDCLSEARFKRWAEVMQSGASGIRRWWTGLLIPLFRRALVQGHPSAEPLWSLVYPFQRERSGGSTRFFHGYIDWILHDLSYPEVDDQTAKNLLRSLILDCRTDRELFEIALGARYEGQSRIESVLELLLSCREPETRARTARVLGWLDGSETRLGDIAAFDPSLWVRRIAKSALEVRRNEGFSRHWFEVFLRGESREARWGAGQLFLESVDASGMIWARRFLRKATVDARVHGEAMLLLRSAEQEVKNRREAWGKSFLGYSVSGLEHLWDPWQHRADWADLE